MHGRDMTNDVRKRPVVRWYVLAALLIASAMTLPFLVIVPIVAGTGDELDGMQRFTAPGSLSVQIDEPGTFVLDYLSQGSLDGQVYSTSSTPPGVRVTLTRDADGARIRARESSVGYTYQVGATHGERLFEFRIDDSGAYTVSAAPTLPGGPHLFAFGKPMDVFGFVVPVIVATIGAILLLMAGLTVLILTIVRHARAGRVHSST